MASDPSKWTPEQYQEAKSDAREMVSLEMWSEADAMDKQLQAYESIAPAAKLTPLVDDNFVQEQPIHSDVGLRLAFRPEDITDEQGQPVRAAPAQSNYQAEKTGAVQSELFKGDPAGLAASQAAEATRREEQLRAEVETNKARLMDTRVDVPGQSELAPFHETPLEAIQARLGRPGMPPEDPLVQAERDADWKAFRDAQVARGQGAMRVEYAKGLAPALAEGLDTATGAVAGALDMASFHTAGPAMRALGLGWADDIGNQAQQRHPVASAAGAVGGLVAGAPGTLARGIDTGLRAAGTQALPWLAREGIGGLASGLGLSLADRAGQSLEQGSTAPLEDLSGIAMDTLTGGVAQPALAGLLGGPSRWAQGKIRDHQPGLRTLEEANSLSTGRPVEPSTRFLRGPKLPSEVDSFQSEAIRRGVEPETAALDATMGTLGIERPKKMMSDTLGALEGAGSEVVERTRRAGSVFADEVASTEAAAVNAAQSRAKSAVELQRTVERQADEQGLNLTDEVAAEFDAAKKLAVKNSNEAKDALHESSVEPSVSMRKPAAFLADAGHGQEIGGVPFSGSASKYQGLSEALTPGGVPLKATSRELENFIDHARSHTSYANLPKGAQKVYKGLSDVAEELRSEEMKALMGADRVDIRMRKQLAQALGVSPDDLHDFQPGDMIGTRVGNQLQAIADGTASPQATAKFAAWTASNGQALERFAAFREKRARVLELEKQTGLKKPTDADIPRLSNRFLRENPADLKTPALKGLESNLDELRAVTGGQDLETQMGRTEATRGVATRLGQDPDMARLTAEFAPASGKRALQVADENFPALRSLGLGRTTDALRAPDIDITTKVREAVKRYRGDDTRITETLNVVYSDPKSQNALLFQAATRAAESLPGMRMPFSTGNLPVLRAMMGPIERGVLDPMARLVQALGDRGAVLAIEDELRHLVNGQLGPQERASP